MAGFLLSLQHHPYIPYILVASAAVYLLVAAVWRLPWFSRPELQMWLWSLPLLAPVLGYIYYLGSAGRCSMGLEPGGGMWPARWHIICRSEPWFTRIILPLMFATFAYSLFKIFANSYVTYRIIKKNSPLQGDDAQRVTAVLEPRLAELGIGMPGLRLWPGQAAVAFTMGFTRPVLVVSRGLLEKFDDGQLEAVLTHELVHLARRDTLRSWLGVLLRDGMFFSPFSQMAFRRFMRKQEEAVDDRVVAMTKKPLLYAEALLRVWKDGRELAAAGAAGATGSVPREFLVFPGFASHVGTLENRIRRVLNPEVAGKRFLVAGRALLALVLGLVLLGILFAC